MSQSNAMASTAIASIPTLVGLVAAGKLAGVNVEIQSAVAKTETSVDSEIDALFAKLDAAEMSDLLVQQAVHAFTATATTLGLQLPTEDGVRTHLKAAANDLLGTVKAA